MHYAVCATIFYHNHAPIGPFLDRHMGLPSSSRSQIPRQEHGSGYIYIYIYILSQRPPLPFLSRHGSHGWSICIVTLHTDWYITAYRMTVAFSAHFASMLYLWPPNWYEYTYIFLLTSFYVLPHANSRIMLNSSTLLIHLYSLSALPIAATMLTYLLPPTCGTYC